MIEEEYVFDGPTGAVTLNGEPLDVYNGHEDEDQFGQQIHNVIIPFGALTAFSKKYDVVWHYEYGRERVVYYKQKLEQKERIISRLRHLSGRIQEIEGDLSALRDEVSTLSDLISAMLKDEELSQ